MIFIPFIILIVVFYFYQRTRDKLDMVTYLFLVYLLMCVSSIFLHFSGLFPGVYKFSFEAMGYLGLCFIIIFLGYSNYREDGFNFIKINNLRIYKWLENVIMVGGIGSIIFFLPYAMQNLRGDVRMNRILNQDVLQVELAGFGIINSLFSLFANLFVLALLFSFINYAAGPKHKRKAFLLLLSSFSFIFYILAYAGRDGVVFWIMTFIFIYFLMRDFIDHKLKKSIKRIFIMVIPIIMIPFFIITISRFSYGSIGIFWQITNYMGQQIKNFNDAYLVDAAITYGRGLFPLFTDWLSNLNLISGSEESILQYKFQFKYAGVNTWVFKTYIGSFLISYGKLGTVIVLSLLTLFSRRIFKKTKKTQAFNLPGLVIYILLYQTVLWGVFYFRYALNNIYIIAMLFIAIILNFKNYKNRDLMTYIGKYDAT